MSPEERLSSRIVPLTQGRFAIVDASDYEEVSKYKWIYNSGYALRAVISNKKRTIIHMHRLIHGSTDGLEVDHVNGCGVDNRRINLRTATRQQNGSNRAKCRNSTSIYKGVFWDKKAKKWVATIVKNKKQNYLGYFNSEIEAAKSYNKAAIELHGEFARLNDIHVKGA